MQAVKGASGGETGQDMTTRHNACVVAATAMLLTVSTARADTIPVAQAGPAPGPARTSSAAGNATHVANGTPKETILDTGAAQASHAAAAPPPALPASRSKS